MIGQSGLDFYPQNERNRQKNTISVITRARLTI